MAVGEQTIPGYKILAAIVIAAAVLFGGYQFSTLFKSDFEKVTGYKNMEELLGAKVAFQEQVKLQLLALGGGDVFHRAENGEAEAQYILGGYYFYGIKLFDVSHKPDRNAAEKWYQKAAMQNYAPAMYQFGRLQTNGAASLDWYKKAAKAGYKWAQIHLGEIYMSEFHLPDMKEYGAKLNYKEAYFWLSLGTAGEERSSDFVRDRDIAKAYLTPAEVKEVDKKVEEWKKTHPPTFE